MSTLNLAHRPIVRFDPADPEHREIYHQFKKNRGWGKAKYRFVIDDTVDNLVDHCDRKLVIWYLNNEFGSRGRTDTKK